MRSRRAFLLPAVLVIVGLLALTLAGFTFFVRAELAGAQAKRDLRQAELAAQSGFREVTLLLRTARTDPSAWWDVQAETPERPYRLRNVLMWSEGYTRESDPLRQGQTYEDLLAADEIIPAWRYSVVAINHDGIEDTMRYGLTPEAGKLNINSASEEELTRLLTEVLADLNQENAPQLVDALLDWLDEDDDVRPNGAERDYYEFLDPGYRPKNGPLESIEELLLVKGFTAAVLYGEDVNRNGILDRNEDDGDESFPYYDNGDGVLNFGLAPYVTVWSREPTAAGGGGGSGGGQQEEQGEDESNKDGDVRQSRDEPAEDEGDQLDEGALGEEFLGEGEELGAEGQAQDGAGGGGEETQPGGKIDVNSAPARVLRALGLSDEAASNIVTLRTQQPAESRQSLDWLVSAGALTPEEYAAVQDRLTTQAYQFHVEIVGYADHQPTFSRHEWIVEVRGPTVQVLYHRDLSRLGRAWPVDDETVIVQPQ